MLWKWWTKYDSKFGKLSSGHGTGKGQFSFQSQRKATPKNAQITAQLHSSHTLVKLCSKLSKPGFNNMWIVNFQMLKLILEKTEEPEIKLPKQETSRKKKKKKHIYFCFNDYGKAFFWITTNCGKFFKKWEYQTIWSASWEICMQVKNNS